MGISVGCCRWGNVKGRLRSCYKQLINFLAIFIVNFVGRHLRTQSLHHILSLRHPCYELRLEVVRLVGNTLSSKTLNKTNGQVNLQFITTKSTQIEIHSHELVVDEQLKYNHKVYSWCDRSSEQSFMMDRLSYLV